MFNPWVLLGVALAWAASVVAVGVWQREDGALAERTTWQAMEIGRAKAAMKKVLEEEDKTRKAEQAGAKALAEQGAKYEAQKQDRNERHERELAAARDGSFVLRIPGMCPGADRSTPPDAHAAAGSGDGATAGELPREVTADLLKLTKDADDNTDQLTACQAVVETYLATNQKGASP